ncbi:MAG: FecR domain-containing protein, partial [Nitrospinae bacterium]|nr:FecR domain-containing protein [Nitrospinota bacterium]
MTHRMGFLTALVFLAIPLNSAAVAKDWVAKVVSVEGTIEAQLAGQEVWQTAKVGDTYYPGDTVRVPQWRAAIVLSNETIIRLDRGTIITFTKVEEEKPAWLNIVEGIVHFISRVRLRLNVTTPFVNAFVEGTEFVIQVERGNINQTRVWVIEGRVRVQNQHGSLVLIQDQAAVAKEGQAPLRLDFRLRDAVQWALYYPPLIDTRTEMLTGPNQQTLEGALAMYHGGDLLLALRQLDAVSPDQRDTPFYNLRAGLLLSVGRVERARDDIAQSMALDPSNGVALALHSIIDLAQNEKEAALEKARKAVKHTPDSPVTHMALSYAQQAAFDIDLALESSQEATRLAPKNGLAWARVSELWLSKGYLDESLEAADKAVAKNPDLSRTQTVLGFAALTQAKIKRGRKAFEKAIELDSADPLPRLGLGLAKIKKSDLAEGRREIEIAASLDPNNSLIRSYLGKAYYEERRDPGPSYPLDFSEELPKSLSGSQFALAKEFDPQDPTPYFYDAIRKQSINRPVEALQDLRKSIELNDNRAVYRSRLLLDEDHAARSATIGRIYSDLGFQQRALVEGW